MATVVAGYRTDADRPVVRTCRRAGETAVEAVENGDIQFVPKQYENSISPGCAIFRTGVSLVSYGGSPYPGMV